MRFAVHIFGSPLAALVSEILLENVADTAAQTTYLGQLSASMHGTVGEYGVRTGEGMIMRATTAACPLRTRISDGDLTMRVGTAAQTVRIVRLRRL